MLNYFVKIPLRSLSCFCAVFVLLTGASSLKATGEIIELKSKNTLTVIELNNGDEVSYQLASGRVVSLKILSNETDIVFTTTPLPGQGGHEDASVFRMTCRIEIDGQEMDMIRFAPVDESFYVPYVVSGLSIWFDALKSLGDFYNENHGHCLPEKQVRLAIHDASLAIAPDDLGAWCPLPENFPDVRSAYRGDDTWLGTYYGSDLHGGLDVNMPSNSPLWAPIPLDNNFYFNTVTGGQNNNRWRALKYWDNGDVWTLQTHHHDQLLVPELQPVSQGTNYAYSGGTLAGTWTHTHFVFKTKQPGFEDYFIDPWIIFWQTLAQNKVRSQDLVARMAPLAPTMTGDNVFFDGTTTIGGLDGATLEYHWSFGDGVYSIGSSPTHVYQRPGIYPVTLIVSNGTRRASVTQHIVVNGEPTFLPEMRIAEKGNITFHKRHTWETDVFNKEQTMIPNTVHFSLPRRSKKPIPPKSITVKFHHAQQFSDTRYPHRIEPLYVNGQNWLQTEVVHTNPADSSVEVLIKPDISRLVTQEGESVAYLIFNDNNFTNSPQVVRVVVKFHRPETDTIIMVDNDDANCIKSNGLWLTTKLDRKWSNFHGDSYLINSGVSGDGFIRYFPNLSEGRYAVRLSSPLYSEDTVKELLEGFYVNVTSKGNTKTVWIDPRIDLEVGVFDFDASEGYVEIVNTGSKGLVVADAVVFEKR